MKDKIKYYLLLLAFLFIMALILWFFHDWIEQYMSSVYYLKDGKIAKASETLFEDRLYY